jgi:hydroxyacylglutathione hydrolase
MRIEGALSLAGSGAFGLSQSFDCHVYVVDCGNCLIMIDAGAGESPRDIAANMEKDGLGARHVEALLLTHSHLDHSGGAAFIRSTFGCRVHVAAAEKEMLEKGTEETTGLSAAKLTGLYSPGYPVRHCAADVVLEGGEELRFGDLTFSVIAVPGHSPGSLCYCATIPGIGRTLFTGDVVSTGGVISVLNMDGSSLAAYRRCLPRLGRLGIDALMPGHGLFAVRGGQGHIDAAIESLRLLRAPRNML